MSHASIARIATISIVLAAVAMVGAAGAIAAPGQPHARGGGGAWSYEGSTGPEHWGSLDPSYATCADGSVQSPIDITGAVGGPLPNPTIAYRRDLVTIVNNGHTVQANALSGSSITVDGVTSQLLQMHFHAPAENIIAGQRAPVDVHFVHKAADGALTVIGVMLRVGPRPNAAWQPFVRALRLANLRAESEASETTARFNWSAMLPKDLRSYRFPGSLTTPGCSEGVNWIVLQQPVRLSVAQLRAFTTAYSGNARPVQPINGRPITLDTSRN
jgi:carbonic anhydrase